MVYFWPTYGFKNPTYGLSRTQNFSRRKRFGEKRLAQPRHAGKNEHRSDWRAKGNSVSPNSYASPCNEEKTKTKTKKRELIFRTNKEQVMEA